ETTQRLKSLRMSKRQRNRRNAAPSTQHPTPLVGVIMGSKSDWDTMQKAADVLAEFGVAHEAQVVSAHRTPVWMAEYATSAVARGLEVIIAGAGGAAHLPGMISSRSEEH